MNSKDNIILISKFENKIIFSPLEKMASNSYGFSSNEEENVKIIPGLSGMLDFISEEVENKVVEQLDTIGVWSKELSRRTQHYGFEYNYKSRNASKETTPLSGELLSIGEYLVKSGLFPDVSKLQCIVNEYLRNQGIAAHADAKTFGDTIVSISLLEDTVMEFISPDKEVVPVLLKRRSIVIMVEEARYNWKHSINKTISYIDDTGRRITKSNDYRRISLTFRSMI